MPSRCVVFGCSNTPDPASGIALHKIPYDKDFRPEAIERRQRWLDFIKRKRAKWEPSSTSCVCSNHFKPDDFVRGVCLPGQKKTYTPWLKRDDIGVIPHPTVYAREGEVELSGRAARSIRRKVRNQQTNIHVFYKWVR